MKILKHKRCIIGEGPIWNEKENTLYYTNGGGWELCKYKIKTDEAAVISLNVDCAAFAFDKDNRLIVSRRDGVFILHEDGSTTALYDSEKYQIEYANDMKVGPDGRIYVGTQSEKRLGISDKINGKLYAIDKWGRVDLLIEGMHLSNGMEWSVDETLFYHTDSDTHMIKEYSFCRDNGAIEYTGRQITILGVDGFTIDKNNMLYVARWGFGCVDVVDINTMKTEERIELPCKIPASCGFVGEDMNILAVTTASSGIDISMDKNAGFTFLIERETGGRKPYLFG